MILLLFNSKIFFSNSKILFLSSCFDGGFIIGLSFNNFRSFNCLNSSIVSSFLGFLTLLLFFFK